MSSGKAVIPAAKKRAIVLAACEWISGGEPLTVFCREEGGVTPRSIRNWLQDFPDLQEVYQQARDDGHDVISQDCMDIADEQVQYVAGAHGEYIDSGDVSNRKLRIETRLKLLAKWNPKRYGDSVQHSGPEGGPIEFTHIERVIVRPKT